jgi:hypothetical protein
MSLTARSIVTLNSVKSYLNEPDDALDSFLEEWIDLASGRVEEYTGKKIQPVSIEEVLDGKGGEVLWPKYWPVSGLVGGNESAKLGNLQYRNSATEGWTDLLTDIDLVLFDPKMPFEITLLDGNTFPSGRANIRVEYIAGYDPIPADLQQVVIEMVAKAYQQSKHGEGSLGVASKSVGSAGVSPSTSFLDLEPKWKAVLDRYRSLV